MPRRVCANANRSLLVCGACGRRLTVRYTGNGGLYPVYQCNWKHREG
ncbi:zinc ribbon domain-containing protein [Mesorhizobium sp. M0800]